MPPTLCERKRDGAACWTSTSHPGTTQAPQRNLSILPRSEISVAGTGLRSLGLVVLVRYSVAAGPTGSDVWLYPCGQRPNRPHQPDLYSQRVGDFRGWVGQSGIDGAAYGHHEKRGHVNLLCLSTDQQGRVRQRADALAVGCDAAGNAHPHSSWGVAQ